MQAGTTPWAAQVALAQQAQTLAQALQRATHAHHSVTLAAAVGSIGVNQTSLDDHEPALSALRTSLGTHVSSHALDAARGCALDKQPHPGDDNANANNANRHVPHSADALIALSAQASLAHTASHDLIVSAGDVIHLGSGSHTQLTSGGALRMHSGQALGVLGGAIQAAGNGLTLIAAQGDVTLQAQSGPAQLAAQQDLRIQSANGEINLAAAQTLTLSTADGARITLANGQLTIQCPGTVTVNAANKVLAGGGSVDAALPQMPRSTLTLNTEQHRGISS